MHNVFQRFFRSVWPDVKFYAAVLGVFLAFRTTAYATYNIPSESMLPTLAVGDFIVVNKFAYGYSRHSLPFSLAPDFATESGRILERLPARGDVVVFKHPRTLETYIKRVVALPGDVVEIVGGRVILNGDAVPLEPLDAYRYREQRGGVADVVRYAETLEANDRHDIIDRGVGYSGDDFGPAAVPPNHLFVMGDNRDNSLDSRFKEGVGFLPFGHVVGKAERIMFSVNACRAEPGLECLKRPVFGALASPSGD